MAPRRRAPAIRIRAFAKINLGLHVLGRRTDGYHELRTIFQSIALHDTLTISSADGPFEVECDDPRCPRDRGNLAWRAAEALAEATGRKRLSNVQVHIRKRIPLQGGLGGGSADAAAALRGLALHWRVRMSDDRLKAVGAGLGADVPFFFEGGRVLGLGRGDLLFPLLERPSHAAVLVIPEHGVSTKDAYDWHDESLDQVRVGGAAGVRTRYALTDVRVEPLEKAELVNDLQTVVSARRPEIGQAVAALHRCGALHAAMSGSGSTVFGLFKHSTDARQAASRLQIAGCRTLLTRTLSRLEYQTRSKPHEADRDLP